MNPLARTPPDDRGRSGARGAACYLGIPTSLSPGVHECPGNRVRYTRTLPVAP